MSQSATRAKEKEDVGKVAPPPLLKTKEKAYHFVENGDLAGLKSFITQHPDGLNKTDEDERTPLHWACALSNAEMVFWLLQQPNIKVNSVDDGGWTPLMSACAKGEETIVKALLKLAPVRQQIPVQNCSGNAAIHYAASKNHVSICVDLLLCLAGKHQELEETFSADPEKEASQMTLAQEAFREKKVVSAVAQEEVMALLLLRNRYGECAVHRAAATGAVATLKVLAGVVHQHQKLSSLRNRQGDTPLHLAAQVGGHHGLACVEFLLRLDVKQVGVRNAEKQLPGDVSASKGIFQAIHACEKTEDVPGVKKTQEEDAKPVAADSEKKMETHPVYL